jgi:DNA processing protein
MKDWREWEIKIVKSGDDNFPESLKVIKNKPRRLYYRGEWDSKLFDKSLAIVGSRRMTRYGKEVLEKFIPDLVANKITIISGFMYGVDSWAHQLTVESGGKTVAVLGGGLDELTPTENDKLYSQIVNNGGLVISEYEADFKPTLWSFPQRNRLVAGLASLGVLVVEADIKSGSLITARMAVEQKKKLWAVPGMITAKMSNGTNFLIAQGEARVALTANDIIGDKAKIEQLKLEIALPVKQKLVWDLIEAEPMTIDEISRQLGLEIAEVSVVISQMTIEGLITEEMGKIYPILTQDR